MVAGYHYIIEQNQYAIIEHDIVTYTEEIEVYLIFDVHDMKYKMFAFDVALNDRPLRAHEVVEKGSLIKLELARLIYPGYKLNAENYGEK